MEFRRPIINANIDGVVKPLIICDEFLKACGPGTNVQVVLRDVASHPN